MNKSALIILYVTSIFLSFAGGAVLSQRCNIKSFNDTLEEVQAMLWFNHLHQLREIEADLEKMGCEEVALEKTRIAIDGELQRLASFHKGKPVSSVNKYISERDAKLLDDLDGFKSKYGSSWTVPQCDHVSRGSLQR